LHGPEKIFQIYFSYDGESFSVNSKGLTPWAWKNILLLQEQRTSRSLQYR